MIKKLLDKFILWYSVRQLKELHNISEQDRMDAYVGLYQNIKMMKVLENILIQDTKVMMAKDWMNEKEACKRFGLFSRARDIKNNAEYYYNLYMKTK